MDFLSTDLAPGRRPLEPEKLVRREPVDPSKFKRMIRQMGLRVTQQRIAILQSLGSGRAHVTAQEVFETVSQNHPEIGFATVYRFLRKMAQQKLVTEVRMGGLPARYELTPRRHHDHLTCVECGQIVEFECQPIEALQEKVAQEKGFKLTHHVLELYGLCPTCQAE
ncbi:MAG: Fur family transcriptional regulator [Bdellovibrionales bacterium]